MNLDTLQAEARGWRMENFPPEHRTAPLHALGVCEEAGELAHAILKREQNIRGTQGEHTIKAADAMGDIIIYMVGLCDNLGLDLSTCVRKAWDEVKARDWKKDPIEGKA